MGERIKGLLFIMSVVAVSISALLWIRNYTFPIIEHNQEITLKETVLQASGISYESSNLQQRYNQHIRELKQDGFVYYLNSSGDYIFKFLGRGLWGLIEGVISLYPDKTTIKKVRIIAQEETPGLGGRIAEEEYLKQFEGKQAAPELKLIVRGKASGSTEVDAITGASLSSSALTKTINQAVKEFREKVR